MFKKNKKQTETVKEPKEKKVRTVKVGTHKKTMIALWVVLIASVSFGVYKNFTAIDQHTTHEKEIIELRLQDTNGIANFEKNFAKSYYTWSNSKEAIEARTQAISGYLTKELQALNTDTIRKDIPVSSAVNGVQIWSVTQADENQFSVIFTVEQLITENGSTKTVRSAYEVTVYVDGSGNMVLTKNPTITSIPVKSGYTPKAKESDGTVDAVTTDEINEFLTTFFKLYPTATAKELSYYVNEGVLKPIGKDYVFSELVNPIYNRIDSQVTVSVAVKYLDQQTKATQVSQFDLVLEKSGSNWKIIK